MTFTATRAARLRNGWRHRPRPMPPSAQSARRRGVLAGDNQLSTAVVHEDRLAAICVTFTFVDEGHRGTAQGVRSACRARFRASLQRAFDCHSHVAGASRMRRCSASDTADDSVPVPAPAACFCPSRRIEMSGRQHTTASKHRCARLETLRSSRTLPFHVCRDSAASGIGAKEVAAPPQHLNAHAQSPRESD